MFNKKVVKGFRTDFQNTISELESKYGVVIDLGTIRWEANELRSKITVVSGERKPKMTNADFQIGDIVGIAHQKYDGIVFKVLKINRVKIKLENLEHPNGRWGKVNCPASMIFKIDSLI